MTPDLDDLRAAVQASHFIAALTGAGISAESGIPTFRGPGGLWRSFRPEELATPEAFQRDPHLVWEWYNWRRGIIRRAEPNPGNRALASLERLKGDGFRLITQNIDGLHDSAGSRHVAKLHGDIWRVRCTGCGSVTRHEEVPLRSVPPLCACGALLRPDVVWFGEPLPELEWREAVDAGRRAQLFLLIGTSAVVYPAAGLVELARSGGARVAVINPEATPLDHLAEWALRGPAGEILPQIVD